ncbi:unnamed protein product [Leptidea sinapis]|uniref:Major facilitator superfamily (MFS) profile domain-containing protein n=1 Tax=Leptidea sinapis TaxID=189913 RepID=A0A5E4QS26_9NEOP|nr:unnamed protein product [Leptidea sinapis]
MTNDIPEEFELDGIRRLGSQQDLIQEAIGSFGTYQFLLCALVFLSKIPIALHQMAIIFLAPNTDYMCPEKNTCPCPAPQFNTSIFTNTIIMQWSLICDDKWLVCFTQTIFQFGTLVGSILFGMASDRNKRPTTNLRSTINRYQALVERNSLKKGNILDLFKTPNMRKNILAMSFNWLACSYCFYGVSQYIGQLSGNIFINVLCSASVTLLGTLCSIPLMKLIGRRTILIVFNFVCAACLFILAALPQGLISVVFASIGVVSSFIVFVLVYLFCSELFPTVVRTAAIGFSSMMARIGSMIAPFVIALDTTAVWLPPVLFAVIPLISGFVAFLLPETKGYELMTTLEEGENFGKKNNT